MPRRKNVHCKWYIGGTTLGVILQTVPPKATIIHGSGLGGFAAGFKWTEVETDEEFEARIIKETRAQMH